MKEMLNFMRMQSLMASSKRTSVRLGTIDTYDHANYCARVIIEPDGSRVGPLPVLSPWTGNGWGMFCPPTPGDLVEVHFQEGDIEAGFICGRFFNDISRPLDVPSGEFWLFHKTGSFLKFHNDGSVELNSNTNLTATVGGNLSATVTGNANVAVTGNITSSAALWTHTGPLTVNGAITGTQGMTITGIYPSSAYSVILGGTMQWNNVNITANGQMTFNGKRIDDTLRVSGVQPGSGTSGTPV